MIGSPLGGTIANLLSRHKDQLGIKYVSKVRIVTRDPPKHGFGSKHKHEFHVIFHIEDVPADQVPEYKPEDKTKRSERVIRQDESENAYLHVQMVHI